MSRSPGGRRTQHAVMATANEWARIRELADEASAGLRGTVALLFEARLDEMAREGRGEEMEALLARVIGPERAAGIVRQAAMRAGGGETGGAG